MLKKYVCFLFLLSYSCFVAGETIFTFQNKESENDVRSEYARSVFELALQKTQERYGAYQLLANEIGTNAKRSLFQAKNNHYPNFFVLHSVTTELLNTMSYVPFPIDRGIVGYRVAFASKETKEKLKSVETIEDLRQFTFLQGTGWQDGSLLKLWQKYYQPSIEFSALKRRKVFELNNPFIEILDPAYKQYNFDPFSP
jgi:hypothetical protein